MPRYFKERGQPVFQDSSAREWGDCVRYIEIADDLYASRQVDDYGKGRVLRYDRTHNQDSFGILSRRLFSHKKKAISGETIEPEEFERVWRLAQDSV